MPDARFFYRNDPMIVRDCVRIAGAKLVDGSAEGTIMSVADAGEDDLTGAALYCTDEKRIDALKGRAFGLCFVSETLADKVWRGGAIAVSSSPRLSFSRLGAALYEPKSLADMQRGKVRGRVHESAIICGSAKIGDDPVIGPNVVIGPGVEIGDGVRIGANVTIAHTLMGNDVHILPGAAIGQAGFGFEVGENGLERVPQLGRVIIGNHVDIGANTTIDRGALRDTVIADGVKIDNLVQIGHNVEIGEHSVIAAQTGISGSCVIGKGVFMGGKVGLTDHVNIGDGAKLAAGTGLMRDVPAGEAWGGRPGRPVKVWLKETAVLAKLARKKSERK